MARLETLTLFTTDPAAQRAFYCDVLGMSDLADGKVGYGGEEMAIRFLAADKPYAPNPSDLYWKIAICVPDIERAYHQLLAAGVECSVPEQFLDVGYLAHFRDPAGLAVELIDHWFQGERPEAQFDENLFGGGAHIGLLTLRTGDIAAVEPDILASGMKPLSVQKVDPYGFTLYFYADTDDVPPDPDLQAVGNRTWVYQRPYTVLEYQHKPGLLVAHREEGQSGYGGYRTHSVK